MKTLSSILAVVLVLMCGVSALAEESLDGGWTATEDAAVTEEASAALNKALETFVGSEIEPIALLGTQVVAGTNYCLLCRVTPVVPDAVGHYALVYVYAGVDGTAEVLDMVDVELGVSNPT